MATETECSVGDGNLAEAPQTRITDDQELEPRTNAKMTETYLSRPLRLQRCVIESLGVRGPAEAEKQD